MKNTFCYDKVGDDDNMPFPNEISKVVSSSTPLSLHKVPMQEQDSQSNSKVNDDKKGDSKNSQSKDKDDLSASDKDKNEEVNFKDPGAAVVVEQEGQGNSCNNRHLPMNFTKLPDGTISYSFNVKIHIHM